jgi:antitoxin ParD1/3/4
MLRKSRRDRRNFWRKYQLLVPLFKAFTMARNTSILLGEHFESFVSTEVSSGRYNSVSEVIRSALRLLEAEEQKKKDLINALKEGEKSGFVKNFDPKAHLKRLHSKFL